MTPTQHTTPITLQTGLHQFLASLESSNKSQGTIIAYRTDITQFIRWLGDRTPQEISKLDIIDYLTFLTQHHLTAVTRGRKLAAIREYFRFLKKYDFITTSPAEDIDTPKPEKYGRVHLQEDEYTRLLAVAGGNPRDYAILQVFLQNGIRVAELCGLTLSDIDLPNQRLSVRAGKGGKPRDIALASKAVTALKNYLKERPPVPYEQLFLNRDNLPISDRGVQKLIVKYRRLTGITKKMTCHSLRHTFATQKARQGVTAFQLKEWLGHEDLKTTQIYVHLGQQDSRKVMEATSL